jgi:hypothetical protein
MRLRVREPPPRGKRRADEGMGLSVEGVRKPPDPAPEMVTVAQAKE